MTHKAYLHVEQYVCVVFLFIYVYIVLLFIYVLSVRVSNLPFGGYLAAMALVKMPSVFTAAVACGPVVRGRGR